MTKIWTWVNIYDDQAMVRAKKGFRTPEAAMKDAAADVYKALKDVDDPKWTFETAEWTTHTNESDELRMTYVEDAAIEVQVYAIDIE